MTKIVVAPAVIPALYGIIPGFQGNLSCDRFPIDFFVIGSVKCLLGSKYCFLILRYTDQFDFNQNFQHVSSAFAFAQMAMHYVKDSIGHFIAGLRAPLVASPFSPGGTMQSIHRTSHIRKYVKFFQLHHAPNTDDQLASIPKPSFCYFYYNPGIPDMSLRNLHIPQ